MARSSHVVFFILLFICLLGCSEKKPPVQYDYKEGIQAHKKGDYKKAYDVFKHFAEKGDSNAQVFLGFMLDNGQGVQACRDSAAQWYEKAAKQGHLKSQQALAFIYISSSKKDGPKDLKKALYWYKKAIDNGFAKAMYQMGYFCRTGKYFPKDHKKANSLISKAADYGDEQAQVYLGEDLIKGIHFKQDFVQAYKWLLLAKAKLSVEDETPLSNRALFYNNANQAECRRIESLLNEIKPKMTSEQLKKAIHLAKTWQPKQKNYF